MLHLGSRKIKDGQGPTCDCQKGRRHSRWSWVGLKRQIMGQDGTRWASKIVKQSKCERHDSVMISKTRKLSLKHMGRHYHAK